MIRGYKYKLNLTKRQEAEMEAARIIYNMTLYYANGLLKEYKEYNDANPDKEKKYLDYDELVTRIVDLKKLPENIKLKMLQQQFYNKLLKI
jgi:hypothetical protein